MAKYIVSYDLHQPGKDYDDLIKFIKTSDGWAHIHESVWFVETSLSAKDLRDALRSYADSNDGIFVVQEAGIAAWTNTLASDDYLKTNL